ncbi:BLUF domain-containing protein [Comamonas thiooxydans]|uniref:BLUF domain-containing protein n=1 Tax=Comamonas thiooxydans TaxID=363952 RepID=UPI0020CE6395|nr:BLUF domain-containing protein [Comamonas thiooxydans]BDR09752.1 BLUF domain-containing protein [Comamonas thiooxydans]
MALLGCFLYHSDISVDENVSCVADIVRLSRGFNENHDITGLLIFDGQHFVEYIEGPSEHVLALFGRIALDTRHTKFTPLHEAQGITQRHFSEWNVAYVSDEDANPLLAIWALEGEAAVTCLLQLLPQLDTA